MITLREQIEAIVGDLAALSKAAHRLKMGAPDVPVEIAVVNLRNEVTELQKALDTATPADAPKLEGRITDAYMRIIDIRDWLDD